MTKQINSLTLENFWNDLEKKCPQAMEKFKKWVDDYKKEIGWDLLFNIGSPHYSKMGWHTPKFHDLPFDFQRGVLTRFFEETIGDDAARYKKDAIEGCAEFFEALDKNLKEKIKIT